MAGMYRKLNRVDLTKYFFPEQNLELRLDRNSPFSEESLSVSAVVVSLDRELQLKLAEEGKLWLDHFVTGKLLTIYYGWPDRVLVFKSKIIGAGPDGTLLIEPPTVMISKERHSGARIPLLVPVTYRVLGFKNKNVEHLCNKQGNGESQELSLGGMRIFTDLRLPPGLIVIVEFSFEGKSFELTGSIRRVQELKRDNYQYGIGIQFLKPTFEEREQISQLLDRLNELDKEDFSV